MADYRTTNEIIDIVYGLLSSITVSKFKHTKPTHSTDTEYVVINSLPIPANVMQKCLFNVNYHVRDIIDGAPDLTKLKNGETAVLNILQRVSTTYYLIDFESQETIRDADLGEHFSNLRFSFKYVNS